MVFHMASIAQTARGYLLWTYERGTLHYDVMVTAILAFVFISPHYINYKDKPIERSPHQTGVVVNPDGQGGLVYEIDSKAVQPGKDSAIQGQLLRVIEPISGETSISRYEAVTDKKGKVLSYKVWVNRQ